MQKTENMPNYEIDFNYLFLIPEIIELEFWHFYGLFTKVNKKTIRICAENCIKLYPNNIENGFIEVVIKLRGIIYNLYVKKNHLRQIFWKL